MEFADTDSVEAAVTLHESLFKGRQIKVNVVIFLKSLLKDQALRKLLLVFGSNLYGKPVYRQHLQCAFCWSRARMQNFKFCSEISTVAGTFHLLWDVVCQ